MNLQKISINDALNIDFLQEQGLKFGLIYSYDSVQLNKIENLSITKETLIEAHFFNEEKEVHIFKRDELEATLLIEEENEEYFNEKQLLMNRAKELMVRNYIRYDEEDNQAYVSYTRPYNVIF